MSQGSSDDKQALEIIIGDNLINGTEKTKSLYSFARIYRVPKDLCKLNETAYIPRLVAIGPLHRKDEHLPKYMQDVKRDYANRLFLRLNNGIADPKVKAEKKEKALRECVETMKNCLVTARKYGAEEKVTMVGKARKYYGEELGGNEELGLKDHDAVVEISKTRERLGAGLKDDDAMVEMLLVDGCFILELLYASYHTNCGQVEDGGSKSNGMDTGTGGSRSNGMDTGTGTGCEKPTADPIFDNILTANIVKNDLILLENQIPLFVLEHLFDVTVDKITAPCTRKLSLEGYVRSFFRQYLQDRQDDTGLDKEQGKTEFEKCYHILHLLHSYSILGKEGQGVIQQSPLHSELTLSATDLRYAGVEFVPSKSLFDVKFTNEGVFGCCCCGRSLEFQIPSLSIGNTTESFLRNVIALEQCSPGVPRCFTSYAKLMDMFINSEEDVQVLVKKEVIHNFLSTDKDVCDLFNKLCKEVVLDDFHFASECQKASKFNLHWRTRAVRYVTRLFLASPWPALAFCLGIVTVWMGIYQFGYSIHKQLHRYP